MTQLPNHNSPKSILFLCTGNYYRSRFAEALFNHLAEINSLAWRAVSRGIAAEKGIHNVGPISPYARQELARLGIHLNGNLRLPTQLIERDLQTAARIIALDETEHRPLLAERFPAWQERVEYWQVRDIPWTTPPQALAAIEQQTRALVHSLK